MIRIVVIDDSPFMRKAIQLMAESDPEIKVVGMAPDGMESVGMVRNLRPDCVTLDLEMPRMNGLEALDIIMGDAPTPVLVVSSISTEGAAITLEALDRWAMDYIPKTQSFVAIDITSIKDELVRKIKTIVQHAPTKGKAFMDALKRRQASQIVAAIQTRMQKLFQALQGISEKNEAIRKTLENYDTEIDNGGEIDTTDTIHRENAISQDEIDALFGNVPF